MKEFLLIFRNDYTKLVDNFSPNQMQTVLTNWIVWMGSIVAQNKMVNSGSRLSLKGKTVKSNNIISDVPYDGVKELVGGFTIIRASNMFEATQIAKDCPLLVVGGTIEVRNLIGIDGSEE